MNGLEAESARTLAKAINHCTAGPVEIHLAARTLLRDGKKDEAIRLFQLNARRFPNQWPVHVGLMRACAATGDEKKALAEAKLALGQAPDDPNKKSLEGMIEPLEEGKDID